MHNLLHWGGHLNWTPIVCLALAAALVFLTRMLTVWFYMRTLRTLAADESSEEAVRTLTEFYSTRKPAVPPIVSSLYFLCGIALILVTIWGLISTAWWVLPLGVLCWYLVHIPGREVMESWASFQRTSTVLEDTDRLSKGGLTTEEETAIKKRLDCTSEDVV